MPLKDLEAYEAAIARRFHIQIVRLRPLDLSGRAQLALPSRYLGCGSKEPDPEELVNSKSSWSYRSRRWADAAREILKTRIGAERVKTWTFEDSWVESLPIAFF